MNVKDIQTKAVVAAANLFEKTIPLSTPVVFEYQGMIYRIPLAEYQRILTRATLAQLRGIIDMCGAFQGLVKDIEPDPNTAEWLASEIKKYHAERNAK